MQRMKSTSARDHEEKISIVGERLMDLVLSKEINELLVGLKFDNNDRNAFELSKEALLYDELL